VARFFVREIKMFLFRSKSTLTPTSGTATRARAIVAIGSLTAVLPLVVTII